MVCGQGSRQNCDNDRGRECLQAFGAVADAGGDLVIFVREHHFVEEGEALL